MPQTHFLKTDKAVFEADLSGTKTHECRFNDRDYQVGDILVLQETEYTGEQMKNGFPLVYTGRELRKYVTHILTGYGLEDGWVNLSFKDYLTLTGKQLSDALEFIAPDRTTDADQLEYGVGIGYFPQIEFDGETVPAGLYIWDEEYPEEGRMPLFDADIPAEPHASAKRIIAARNEFGKWFRRNYPGPDTIIMDPEWHAPRIFGAAIHFLDTSISKGVNKNETL